MEFIDIEAKTIDSAIVDGINQLEARGLSVDKTEVIRQPSSGFLGFGRKLALVRLYYVSNDDVQKDVATNVETVVVDKESFVETNNKQEDIKQLVAESGKTFLADLLKQMSLTVSIEKRTTENGIFYNILGDNIGVLIGKHGQTLEAISYLTGLVANKVAKSHFHIVVDVENYRARREETLKQLAYRLANKVKKYREPITLEPMNGYERKIIHLALQDAPYVVTNSEGEGKFRHIVISYKA